MVVVDVVVVVLKCWEESSRDEGTLLSSSKRTSRGRRGGAINQSINRHRVVGAESGSPLPSKRMREKGKVQ